MRLAKRSVGLVASPIAEAHAWLPHPAGELPLLDLSQAAPSYPTAPAIAARVAEVAHQADGRPLRTPTWPAGAA